MDLLPNDVLKLIFGLLSSKTRATICSVSKIFCSLSLEVSTAYWPTNCQAIQIPLLDKIYISNKDKKSILRDYHLTVRMKHSELIRIDLACKVGSMDVVLLIESLECYNNPHEEGHNSDSESSYEDYDNYHDDNFSRKYRDNKYDEDSGYKVYKDEYENYYNIALYGAMDGGNLQIINWALASGADNIDNAINYAIKSGHFNIVKYFAKMITYKTIHLNTACANNQFDIARFLYKNKVYADMATISHACASGNLDLVKYMVDKTGTNFDMQPALMNACYKENYNMINYIMSIDFDGEVLPQCFINLCRYGYLNIVKYLYKKGVSENALYHGVISAARANHLDIIIYLVNAYGEQLITVSAFIGACGYGNLGIVKYIINKQSPKITKEMIYQGIDRADMYGHNNVKKYLRGLL